MDDYGVMEHETAMRAVTAALEYDQLDAVNLLCLEHVMRRAQLVEYYHKEKKRADGSSGSKVGIDLEEQAVFMGTQAMEGAIMIAPELIAWVAKEMERQSGIDKQARKAREERALRRK